MLLQMEEHILQMSLHAAHLRQGKKPVSLFRSPSGQNVNKNVFELLLYVAIYNHVDY